MILNSPEASHEPLLKTKLIAPQLRAGLVPRPRLISKLDEGVERALTLISAPAGYGKTTLLTEWIASLAANGIPGGITVCWLSLDEGDNDPFRFLSYLVAALENSMVEMSTQDHIRMHSSPQASMQAILTLLINRIVDLAYPVYLVLDDYQFITNPDVHEGLTFLLNHLPANLHLVISARSDPPMPLHGLRASNQLVEVRAEALRFTPDEVAAFLTEVMHLSISAEDISTLELRTEGWVTGLQMAALSMQGCKDITQFIQSFSGSHRYILDYLAEEALNRQPEDIQRFLLLTSILDRFCASLCAEVLNQSVVDSQITVQTLEHANLFLVALDDLSCWYRYHHLFGDLLRARLQQSAPDLILSLHARASAWYEHNGWIDEAISHSIKAKNWEGTARLVEQNILAFLSRGQLATVMKWIDVLPQELLVHYPVLCIRIASAHIQAGRWYLTEKFLENAEQAIKDWEDHPAGSDLENAVGLSSSKIQWIRAEITHVRAMVTIYSGHSDAALAPIQATLMELTEIPPDTRSWLHWAQGMAYRELGELEPALGSFSEAIRISNALGNVWWDFWSDLGFTTHMAGKLSRAGVLLSEALRLADENQNAYQGNLGRVEAYLSSVLLEQNRLVEALEHITRAVEFIQWWPSQNSVPTTYAYLALIYLALGDLERATAAIKRADQERQNGIFLQFAQCLVDVALARIWLVQKDWSSLDQWVHEMMPSLALIEEDSTQIDRYQEVRLTTLARIWLERDEADRRKDHLDQAVDLLTNLEKLTRANGHGNTLIEVLTFQVRALHVRGDTTDALEILKECLNLAETDGYVRVFVDAGENIREMLSAYLRTPDLPHKACARRLLDAFASSSQNAPIESSKIGLVEPLTARELEVLLLLAEGYSNRQVAERLILAEGTVKFYVHAILEKLDVHSRTQAIARARDINLI